MESTVSYHSVWEVPLQYRQCLLSSLVVSAFLPIQQYMLWSCVCVSVWHKSEDYQNS